MCTKAIHSHQISPLIRPYSRKPKTFCKEGRAKKGRRFTEIPARERYEERSHKTSRSEFKLGNNNEIPSHNTIVQPTEAEMILHALHNEY